LFRWIERWLAEHGPASWTELREPVEREPWSALATALIDGAELSIEPQLDELQAAVLQTRRALEIHAAMQLLGRA
jgi:DNA primase